MLLVAKKNIGDGVELHPMIDIKVLEEASKKLHLAHKRRIETYDAAELAGSINMQARRDEQEATKEFDLLLEEFHKQVNAPS